MEVRLKAGQQNVVARLFLYPLYYFAKDFTELRVTDSN